MISHLALCIGVACATLASVASTEAAVDKASVLRQAKAAYYDLRVQGVASFACRVTPNWRKLLATQGVNGDALDRSVKILDQLRFDISFAAADGSIKLTHNELAGQTKQMQDGIKQIIDGMEQLNSGFFDTWKTFVLGSVFPADSSDYEIEDLGSQYRVSYHEGDSRVLETLTKDFSLRDWNVTAPKLVSSLQPSFTNTAGGLLLSSYFANYRSDKASEDTNLRIAIGYQQVSGVQILQKLNLAGTYGTSPFALELVFSRCAVTKQH